MPSKGWTAALIPALTLAAGSACAQDAPAPAKEEKQVTIPFVDQGNIYTYEADGYGEGVYLQDRARNWYYARFFSRCGSLPYAARLGFKSWGANDTLDRGSVVIADHEQCRISSLTRSSGPPPKPEKQPKTDS